MSQVYTFCKSGGTKTTTPNPIPQNQSQVSSENSKGTYSFKQDGTNQVTFTPEDFPSLGGSKVSAPTKNIGSWGDASKSAIIREPFPDEVAVVKKNVPPLFSKVKKTKKATYYEDDEDELYDEYEESYSDVQSASGFRNPVYGDYYDEDEDD